VRPIGVIHTEASNDEVREGGREIKSTVEIYPRFKRGLKGIDGFSHVFVICYLDQLRLDQVGVLQVHPRRFLRRGLSLKELPLVGVFALNSPSRPNPIGITQAKMLGRRGRRIFVRGLDYFDGTPVLDIKPYHPHYRVRKIRVPHWYSDLERKAKTAKTRRK
jgi:tRNA-Thr(GGU) m(6)t(6)A37 methyltransferase TsaA